MAKMLKAYMPLFIVMFLVFVGFGDQFLPKPLSTASTNTRETLNKYLLGIFPGWKPKTKPNERTEKAVEGLEQNQQPQNP